MYRKGIVSKVDPNAHRVRVKFPSRQDVESGWLEVIVADTRDDKAYGLPSEGAQVACLMDENDEEGCVIGSLYSSVDAPAAPTGIDVRGVTFKDAAKFHYDREAHKLAVLLPDGSEAEVIATLTKIGEGASEWVALSNLVDDAIAAVVEAINTHVTWANSHLHPTGVGPSGPPAAPASSADTPPSTACTTLKAK